MRKQKLLVFFFVLVLVFMGSFVLSGKKPVTYTWSATIAEDSVNLYPSEYEYIDGVDGVNIYYQTQLIDRKTNLENTRILIGINKTSSEAHVGFQGVQVYDLEVTGDGYAGGFPPSFPPYPDPTDESQLSSYLDNFINTIQHPYTYTNGDYTAGYEHILFYISIGANLEDTLDFPVGEAVDWPGHNANIYFWNNFETDDGEGIHYHSLTAHTEYIPNATCYEITRLTEDSWKILINSQKFTLEESYYEGSTSPIGASGKVRTIREYHNPLIASAYMSYAFILTREQ
jgi:hypothetical protein